MASEEGRGRLIGLSLSPVGSDAASREGVLNGRTLSWCEEIAWWYGKTPHFKYLSTCVDRDQAWISNWCPFAAGRIECTVLLFSCSVLSNSFATPWTIAL